MAESTEKKNLFTKLKGFFKNLKTEFKKITWPTKTQLLKSTLVVLVISLILGAFIWLIDFGAKELIGLINGI